MNAACAKIRGWLAIDGKWRDGGIIAAMVAIIVCGSGCAADRYSSESALSPAGPQAERITSLAWLFLIVCAVVYGLVMLTLAGAFFHRRRGETMGPSNDPIVSPQGAGERRMWTVVFTAIVLTVVTLFALLFSDFATGRALRRVTESPDPLRIQVIAHQWWWEIKYLDWPERFGERVPSNIISTANEIHIPVDPQHPVAVEFKLESHDVIHSFWVPNLQGKKDIIPGHPTSLWLTADRSGDYYGDCGEFCGYQHAQMRLVVVAEPVDQFQSWLSAQRQTAPDPGNSMQRRGQNVFLHASCVMCHSIQGTPARGLVGPDLTHVSSRKLLAAGAVPNVPGHLAGWIVDPQRIKPGTRMPQNSLSALDLRALLEYLETLK